MSDNKSSEEEEKKRFPRLSYILGLGNYIGVVIFDNLYQFLAIMLGSAGIIQGFLTSFRQLGAALLTPIWGFFSDKFDRRLFLFVGNLILSLISFIIPFSPNSVIILILLVFQTIFGIVMVGPAWTAYLGDFTVTKTRGTMLGRISALFSLIGNIILLIITFWMDKIDPSQTDIDCLKVPFFISGIGYFIAVIISPLLPKTQKGIQNNTEHRTFSIPNLREIRLPKTLKKFLIADFVFALAWGSAWPLFPYITFELSRNWFDIGFLAFLFGISMAISQSIGGLATDKFGRKRVIIWTRFILIFPPSLMVLAIITNQLYWLFLSNIIVGLFLGASTIAISSLVLDTTENNSENRSAFYISIMNMATGIGAFIGSTITGLLLQIISGNVQPSLALIGAMMLIISFVRLTFWLSYFSIEDTINHKKISQKNAFSVDK